MPAKTPATSTRTLWENIGHGILALTDPLHEKSATSGITYQDEIDLGKQVDGLIKASVKAGLEGRQSDKQVKVRHQAARQSFARSLHRLCVKLESGG